MYYAGEGIILKSMDYKETDKIVSVFSEKKGKIRAVARGIKKPKSSLRACIQPFCRSLLFFSAGKELDLITQGRILDFYGTMRDDLDCTLNGVYLLELLDKTLMDKVPYPGLYGEVKAVFDYINREGLNPLLIRFFEIKLLLNMGYTPELRGCVLCHKKGNYQVLSYAGGGVICPLCYQTSRDQVRLLSGETLSLLNLFIHAPLSTVTRVKASGRALDELELCNEEFMEYHLERRFNMKTTIRLLK